jgi:hypothetical protein
MLAVSGKLATTGIGYPIPRRAWVLKKMRFAEMGKPSTH